MASKWHGLLALVLAYAIQLASAARFGNAAKLTPAIKPQTTNDDLITHVPGFEGPLPSKHHGGYIPVGSSGKRLFYYFAESEGNPQKDPVLLWLNGGPGCSSFDGFVYEHGPFNFKLETGTRHPGAVHGRGWSVKLTANPHAWNKIANVIFLDSPAGVGMSYSTRGQADYITDDDITAADAEEFLRKWFEKHPSFQPNRFFISGESYAGVYVPNLALAVMKGNHQGKHPHINLQGYLVGNGVTDPVVDGNALPAFAAGKSLISQALYHEVVSACDMVNMWNATAGSQCDNLLNQVIDEVADLNVYDVLEDCFVDDGSSPSARSSSATGRRRLTSEQQLSTVRQALVQHGRQWPVVGATPRAGQRVHNWAHLGLNPPCTDARAATLWLNNPDVRTAIHAEPAEVAGEWQLCSDRIFYTRVTPTLIPVHKALIHKYGLRALIYSGDHDMAVPHTGSEVWTSGLGLAVRAGWRPWIVDKQVAGYVVQYEGLSYATVKGAGHMVPENKPKEALAMLSRFLDDTPLAATH